MKNDDVTIPQAVLAARNIGTIQSRFEDNKWLRYRKRYWPRATHGLRANAGAGYGCYDTASGIGRAQHSKVYVPWENLYVTIPQAVLAARNMSGDNLDAAFAWLRYRKRYWPRATRSGKASAGKVAVTIPQAVLAARNALLNDSDYEAEVLRYRKRYWPRATGSRNMGDKFNRRSYDTASGIGRAQL